MRFMGADTTRPPDEIEVLLMLALHNRMVAEQERMNARAK